MREHDVTALTAAELEAARRELAASLARPCSLVRGPAWLPSTPIWPFGPRPARVTRLPACPASTGAGYSG
jgi:hypothetical protein